MSVARRTGTLFAGDLCNTNIYDPADKRSIKEVERIFDEQVGWAVEAGGGYFVAQTPGGAGGGPMGPGGVPKHPKGPGGGPLPPPPPGAGRGGPPPPAPR